MYHSPYECTDECTVYASQLQEALEDSLMYDKALQNGRGGEERLVPVVVSTGGEN